MANKLGIDIGGTKIEAILINEQFQVIERKRVPTNREEGYYQIIVMEKIQSMEISLIELFH